MAKLLKPLSYGSLKTVILHMDFNTRMLLSHSLPSIRTAENLLPCKIKNVTLTPTSIQIDGISYKLDLVRFYPTEGFFEWCDDDGKCPHDVDRYGCDLREDSRMTLLDATYRLKIWEKNFENQSDDNWYSRLDSAKKVNFWRREVERLRRRENQEEPGFSNIFRFAKISKNSETLFQKCEYFEYDQPIRVALDYFFLKFLRNGATTIHTLKLEDGLDVHIPVGVKLNVRHLVGKEQPRNESSGFENICPFLTSFPLETISVYLYEEEDQEVLKLAKKVVITCDYGIKRDFPLFSNRRIHFPTINYYDAPENLMESWKRRAPEIGTHFSFEVPQSMMMATAESFEKKPGVEILVGTGTRLFDLSKNYLIPLNLQSDVLINYVPGPSYYYPNRHIFMVHLKVVEKGKPLCSKPSLFFASSPLSPNCLKAVIKNMEADFRIALSERTTLEEKKVSLKLKNLSIGANSINVGQTYYHVELLKFASGENGYQEMHGCMATLDDVDKYGIRIPPAQLLPGDVDFKYDKEPWKPEDEELKCLEEEREDEEKNYKINEYRQRKHEKTMEYIQWKIERFRLRKEHLEPSYKYFLRFTSVRRGVKKVETMEYDKNLAPARKYLMQKILGGRGQISTENLALSGEDGGVLRLPKELKLSTKHLSVYDNFVPLKEITKKILCPSSLFKSVGTNNIYEEDHDILSAAQKIVIDHFSSRKYFPLTTPPYSNVHFLYAHPVEISNMVKAMRTEKRAVGTHFSFDRNRRQEHEIVELLYKEQGAQIGELKNIGYPNSKTNCSLCVILPIDEHSEINIYQTTIEEQWDMNILKAPTHHSTEKFAGPETRLEMRIRPKGFAKVCHVGI